MTDREAFEKWFPVPLGVRFNKGDDYIWVGGGSHGAICSEYSAQWMAWQAATLAERERCALIAENDDSDAGSSEVGQIIARMIREGK